MNTPIEIDVSTDDVVVAEIDGQLRRISGVMGTPGEPGSPIETVSGDWTTGTYNIQNVVRYNEKFWKSTANNNTTTPGAPGAFWTEIVADGVTLVLQLEKHNTYISYH